MPVWVRLFTAKATAALPPLLTLAVLGGLAAWGSKNDWKVPRFSTLWTKEEPVANEATENAITVHPDSTGPPSSGSALPHAMVISFPSAEAVHKAGIKTKPVEIRKLAQDVTANGMLDYVPSRYTRLSSRATGTVWGVYKEIGDKVRKGELLALIDAAEVGRLKVDFLQNLAMVKVRTTIYDGIHSAGKSGAVSERSLIEAEASLRESRIKLFNNQQALLNLGLPIRLHDVEKLPEEQLVQHLRLLGLPESIRNQYDAETLTANLLPVTAPFDGQVVQRNAGLGEVVQATQPKILFVVGDVRELHIDLAVNPEDVGELRLGQTVIFQPDGKDAGVAKGQLSHISPEVDEKTRRVMVHAHVANNNGDMRPNTFGTGRIVIREKSGALMVPSEGIQDFGNTHLVFVQVSEKSFQARRVQPGLRDGSLVEVTGVQPGEEVVMTGSFALKSELQKDRIASGEN